MISRVLRLKTIKGREDSQGFQPCCWSHHECNTTCFFPWFFLEKKSMNLLTFSYLLFYGKMVYSSLILLLQELTYPENLNHFQFEKKTEMFLNHFSFVQHPFTCVFPCVKKLLTKKWPNFHRCLQGEAWMGRNSAGSWLSGSFWAWVSSSAPSRQAAKPRQAPKFRFCFRITASPFLTNNSTSHKILPPNFWGNLKGLVEGLNG